MQPAPPSRNPRVSRSTHNHARYGVKQVREAFAAGDGFAGHLHRFFLSGGPDGATLTLVSDNESFRALLPDALGSARWEFDERWTLLSVAVTGWMRQTRLRIDFQFQPMT